MCRRGLCIGRFVDLMDLSDRPEVGEAAQEAQATKTKNGHRVWSAQPDYFSLQTAKVNSGVQDLLK